MIKKKEPKYFLEKIINLDFKKLYTPKIRILSHLTMWSIFTLLLVLNFYFGYQFGILSSVLLSLRMIVCNAIVFYLFFYCILPYTLNKKYLFLFILSLPVLIMIWILTNYYFYIFLYESNIKIDFGILDELIKKNHDKKITEIFSIKYVFGHLFEILMALAPTFFIKLVFDLTRLYSRSLNYIHKIERLNVEKLKIENKFLLTQLNPHFLFNTLNNIYALSLKKDDITPNIILKLSEIMRYTLYDADADFIPLSREIKFMENYFDMEKMRYSSKYVIIKDFKLNEINHLEIAPLLFFVFIENAFKYGLKSDEPFLKIILENVDNNLYFAVTNDKLHLNNNNNPTIGGIGIENAKRRLELMYPKNHTLKIIEDENKFTIKLNILLNE